MATHFHLLSGRSLGDGISETAPPASVHEGDSRNMQLHRWAPALPGESISSHFPPPCTHPVARVSSGTSQRGSKEEMRVAMLPTLSLPPDPASPSSTQLLVGPCRGEVWGPDPRKKRGYDVLALLGVTVQPQTWWPGTTWGGNTITCTGAGAGETGFYPRHRQILALGAYSPPQSPPNSPGMGTHILHSTQKSPSPRS